MVKVKSDRADIIAMARAAVEARKKYKESLLRKTDEKPFKKPVAEEASKNPEKR